MTRSFGEGAGSFRRWAGVGGCTLSALVLPKCAVCVTAYLGILGAGSVEWCQAEPYAQGSVWIWGGGLATCALGAALALKRSIPRRS